MTEPDGWFAELPAQRRDSAELAAALLQAADQLQTTVLEVVIKQHELRARRSEPRHAPAPRGPVATSASPFRRRGCGRCGSTRRARARPTTVGVKAEAGADTVCSAAPRTSSTWPIRGRMADDDRAELAHRREQWTKGRPGSSASVQPIR
jgi:hypothetical protein